MKHRRRWCEFQGWNAPDRLHISATALMTGDMTAMFVWPMRPPFSRGAHRCVGGSAFNSLGSRGNRKQLTAVSVVSSHSAPRPTPAAGWPELQPDATQHAAGRFDQLRRRVGRVREWDATDRPSGGIPTAGQLVTGAGRAATPLATRLPSRYASVSGRKSSAWYSTSANIAAQEFLMA